MSERDLIENKAALIAVCKLDYIDIVKELTELVSSIKALPNGDASSVSENEQAKEVCTCKRYCNYQGDNNACYWTPDCEYKEVKTG